MDPLYHIGKADRMGARYAILPGDPGRVEKIARMLESPRFLCRNREYETWLGFLEGEPVICMSTGMGGPSAAIGVEELFTAGVRTFVRIGTCGGIALPVKGGDLVVANAAVRMEGTSKEYVPVEFPAVSNFQVTAALLAAARETGLTVHCGVVQCKDSFYGQHNPLRMPAAAELTAKWEAWKKAGCLGSEMESAAVFIVSQILGARAGCVLRVIANQERAAAGLDNPECYDTTPAIRTAVEAIRLLIREEAEEKSAQPYDSCCQQENDHEKLE